MFAELEEDSSDDLGNVEGEARDRVDLVSEHILEKIFYRSRWCASDRDAISDAIEELLSDEVARQIEVKVPRITKKAPKKIVLDVNTKRGVHIGTWRGDYCDIFKNITTHLSRGYVVSFYKDAKRKEIANG